MCLERNTLYGLYQASCSIKRPGLNFSPKVSMKRPVLSQVLKASVHENEVNLKSF